MTLAQTTAAVTGLTAGSYTVTVIDANGCTTTRTYAITQPDCATVVFTPATGSALPAARVGVPYTQTISTTPAGYTYTATGLPDGLTIDPSSGIISGRPTAVATNTAVAITATNGTCIATANYTLTVTPASNLRVPENPTGTVAGLNYKYYEGFWDALPNFSTLTPLKSGSTTALDLSVRQRDYGYAFQYTGYVTVPTDGQYTFYTSSDDGSQLYIGSTLVVNNDGSHGTLEASGVIGLRAGTHAFTVTYFQNGGGQNLAVSYQGPSLAKQVVPASALRRVAQSSNQLPVANAGLNQSIMLPINSTQLSGTGTDADGTITGYTWSQLSGPTTASFSSTTISNPTVRGLIAGNYVFGLVVADNLGANSLLSQVTVTVKANNTACAREPRRNGSWPRL